MANELVWNERFNIGVENIDSAHQKLFSIVRKLMNLIEDEEKARWGCAEGIKYFKSYAVKHFEEEESYMQSIDYTGYTVHKRLHDVMREKTIPALERDLQENSYSREAMQHFLGICVGWLTGHIMIEDRAITGRISNRWNEVVPENEVAAMEKVISILMSQVFKLDTHIVSHHYSGENFGNSLIYRLTYRSKEGKRMQVFLILEEQLLLKTVGEMLEIAFKKVDKMVVDATKLLAQQLMDSMGMYFKVFSQFELEKDHLMTREQLTREFESGYPRYSLLFDTGIGFFAFCIKPR